MLERKKKMLYIEFMNPAFRSGDLCGAELKSVLSVT